MTDRMYDKDTARHGDVFKCVGKDSGYVVMLSDHNHGYWFRNPMSALRNARRETPSLYCEAGENNPGKFLYNVFDEESAGSDCTEEVKDGFQDDGTFIAAPGSEYLFTVDECKKIEYNGTYTLKIKEAIMPYKAEVTQVTNLNGNPADNFNDEALATMIAERGAEIDRLTDLDKQAGGSKHFKAQIKDLKQQQKAIVAILDSRLEE